MQPTAEAFTLGSALPAGIIKSPENFTPHDYTVVKRMNMRAVDDLLLRLVLGKRQEMGSEGTLYVVMGELHDMPTHKMAQAGLVENLALLHQQQNDPSLKPVFMSETPYNFLEWYLKRIYGCTIPEGQHDNLREQDKLGHVFSRAVMARNRYRDAPHSRNRLYAMLTNYQISLILMDAGESPSPKYIDQKDPIALEVASEKFNINLNNSYEAGFLSSRMSIRNEVMARRAAAGALDHQAGIAILATGRNHLGNKREDFYYEHSLPVALTESILTQDRIMRVFFASALYRYMPERITPDGQHPQITPVVVRGIADNEFNSYMEQDKETGFIKELGESYGSAIPSRFRPPTLPNPQDVLRGVEALLQRCVP